MSMLVNLPRIPKIFQLFVFGMFFSMQAHANDFITRWDLSFPGSGTNQITFYAQIAPGGANYSWQQLPTGASGNGVLTAGYSLRTIAGIPAGAVIRLNIQPNNLQSFSMDSLTWQTRSSEDTERLRVLQQWGTAQWTSTATMFSGCRSLTFPATDIPDLSQVQNMSWMFSECWNTNGITNINQWDVSNVQDMTGLFYRNYGFNQPLDNWNTGNVVSMSKMFEHCHYFNQPLESWNTQNLFSTHAMFKDAWNFNQPLNGWELGRDASFGIGNQWASRMFENARSFNQPLDNWGWPGWFDAGRMFYGSPFNQNIGSWDNWNTLGTLGATSNFEIFSPTFQFYPWQEGQMSCVNMSKTLAGWMTNGSAQAFDWIALNESEVIRQAVDPFMGKAACMKLNERPYTQLKQCELNYLAPCSRWSFVTYWDMSLDGGSGVNQFQFYAETIGDGAKYYWVDMTRNYCVPGYISICPPTAGQGVLSAGNSLRTISDIPANARVLLAIETDNLRSFSMRNGPDRLRLRSVFEWGDTPWTSMEEMFYGCANLDFYCPLTDCDDFYPSTFPPNLSQVSSMRDMFRGSGISVPDNYYSDDIPYIRSQWLNAWDVSNVTNMQGMFQDAPHFNQPLNNWTTGQVTNMSNMFSGASSYNQNLGTWSLNPAVNMQNMLNNSGLSCQNYSGSLAGWDTYSPLVTNRQLGAVGLQYGSFATIPRQNLTTTKSWTITGDVGIAADCTPSSSFITVWQLPAGQTTLSFSAQRADVVQYVWETIPVGTSGSGSFAAGNGNVTISGLPSGARIRLSIAPQNLRRFYINNGVHRQRLEEVQQWGTVPWSSMEAMFYGCTNLQIHSADLPNTSNVSSMYRAFRGCAQLNGPDNIGLWNTTQVTNMQETFMGATAFNQSIGSWNTGSVTTMASMFAFASAFNQPIGYWNVSSVENMSGMFNGAAAFNSEIGSWNTAQVNNMSAMFNNAGAFNQNIGSWNTSSVSSMNSMFNAASQFNQNLSSWNTANVQDMGGMFFGATAYNNGGEPGISQWDVANVQDMSNLFRNSAFNQNLATWVLRSNVEMLRMLDQSAMSCENYSGTLIGWATRPGTPTNRTLGASGRSYGTHGSIARQILTTVRGWTISGDNFSPTCGADYFFETVWDLAFNTTSLSFFCERENGGVEYYWFCPATTQYGIGLFPPGGGIVSIPSLPSGETIRLYLGAANLKSFSVTGGERIFQLAEVAQWGQARWSTMQDMFRNANMMNVTATDLPDLSDVRDMSGMFNYCKSLTGPPNIGQWDVSQVTNMSGMFLNTLSFNQDLSNWDTEHVINMSSMFARAGAFNQSLGNWSLHEQVDMSNMLDNSAIDCENYNQTLQQWAINHPDLEDRILGANNLAYSDAAVAARNQLISGNNWQIIGDAPVNLQPRLVPGDQTETAQLNCEQFASPVQSQRKLIDIGNNGNAFDRDNAQVTITNQFVTYSNPQISNFCSGASGFYQIASPTNTFRIGRRMHTIQSSEYFTQNGGLRIRVYFDPADTVFIINEPYFTEPINFWGWIKTQSNNPSEIVEGMHTAAPELSIPSVIAVPVETGMEAGVAYAEFLADSLSTYIYFASTIFPLPVELTAFHATCEEQGIVVYWSTASEFNNDYFAIERSSDAIQWTEIGRLSGQGISLETQYYSFVDNNWTGLNYYRLAQFDFDGSKQYSRVVEADCKRLSSETVSLYPNPNAGIFYLKGLPNAATVLIFDSHGRLVKTGWNVTEGHSLVMKDLPKGFYTVQVNSEVNTQHLKMVIAK
jgi:surface protein